LQRKLPSSLEIEEQSAKSTNSIVCKNCGSTYTGKFCNNCGQKSSIARINLKYVAEEIPTSIIQIDRGFLYTVKELITRPGHSVREFLAGKRVDHFKPLAFLLITSALYAVTAYFLDSETLVDSTISGFLSATHESNETSLDNVMNWIANNQRYSPLIILPLFSLSSTIVFSEYKYNYFEHLVINSYFTGLQMLIYWVLGFIFFKENSFLEISFIEKSYLEIPLIIGIIYNCWCYIQLYDDKKMPTVIGLTLSTYVLFLLQLIVIIAIAVVLL